MKTILVTGPIGSGKSAVCRRLEELGYRVYDSDSRTKALYESVPGLKEKIEEALGVPFSGIGVIFSDQEKRLALEDIVYPLVLQDIKDWREAIWEEGSYEKDTVFVESAVASERELFQGFFDETWLVTAPLEERIRRNPKAAERDSIQHADETKATRIIVNDSTLEKLYEQI